MNYSPLGSSIHGILQARILVWGAISFSRGSSWLGDRTQVFRIDRQILYLCVTLTSSLIERYLVWRIEGSGLSNMVPLVHTHTHIHRHLFTCTHVETHIAWYTHTKHMHTDIYTFPGDSDGEESTCNVGDPGLTPGSGRSLGEGCGYPHQYSCLENSMDRGDWWVTVHGVAKSWTCLSDY